MKLEIFMWIIKYSWILKKTMYFPSQNFVLWKNIFENYLEKK